MKSFSEREGLKKVRTEIQVDSVDETLRNRLWNVLDYYYWEGRIRSGSPIQEDSKVLFTRLWHNYFKKPVDNLTFSWHADLSGVRTYFLNAHGLKFTTS